MKANSIEEFFGTLQESTVKTWKSHLKTDKYSAHIALNEFYDDIIDLVDTLIENYMGIHGKVKDMVNIMEDDLDAVTYLEELRELAVDGCEKFCKESELKSDVDSILSLIDSTLYKLKELTEHRMISLGDYIAESLTYHITVNQK